MSNFIGRTLHQVRKDILRARWMLLFFAATLAGIVLFATHPAPLQVAGCIDECSTPRDSAVFAIGALSVAAFLLLVVSLVQEDSPTRTDAHWVSEPVAGLPVLASKVFLLVSVELVAIALSQIITVVVLDFSPRLLFPFFANASYTLTTLTLFTVAVAAATPSLKLSIFALFAYGALWFGVEYLYWDSAIQRHYANAHILGLRGDLWMAAICALLVWAYWSRATSVRRRRWTVLLGLTPLVFAWQSPDNAPLRVFSSAAAPSSRLLPEPRVTVKREGYNFRVDIFVAAPAKDTRYRFVNGLVVLQFDEGSSVLLDGAESNTVVDSQLVHDVSARPLADRTETNHWTFLAPYDAAAGRMLERSAAKIVVDGFLVEQKRSLVGELSLVPGGKLARENLRVGVVRPAYDSMPQRVYVETFSLPFSPVFARIDTPAIDSDSNGRAVDIDLPWYVNQFVRQLPPNILEYRAVFNQRRDTVPLYDGMIVDSRANIPYTTSGASRTYGDYAVRSGHGENVDTTVKWTHDGSLLVSEWKYQSHRAFRAVFAVSAH